MAYADDIADIFHTKENAGEDNWYCRVKWYPGNFMRVNKDKCGIYFSCRI